jgi:sugar phosphate isomerase/epimerase
MRENRLRIAAVSGTFNAAMANTLELAESLRPLELLAGSCRWLDTRIITLCTGTCDLENMWRWHPNNVMRGVWKQLVIVMREVARIADRHEVIMAFEPELGNVVNSAIKARMLLDEVGSPLIKVVIDPANLIRPGDLPRMSEILDEAFEWLGPDIALAHAKEIAPDGRMGDIAPGKGVLDWDRYLGSLRRIKYNGALIMHGLPEQDVDEGLAFLRSTLGKIPADC